MALENEFMPCLNNWLLLFAVIALLLYWSKINCIDPKLKQLAARKAREAVASTPKRAA